MARWTKSLPKEEGWYELYEAGHRKTNSGITIWHLHTAKTAEGYPGRYGNKEILTPGELCWGSTTDDDAFRHEFFKGWHQFRRLEQPHA